MIRFLTPALILLLLLTGCRNQEEQMSVSDEEMVNILVDLAVADGATTGFSGFDKDSLTQAYFNQVLQIHHVTMEAHEKNLSILARDFNRMRGILQEAEKQLESEPQKSKLNIPQ